MDMLVHIGGQTLVFLNNGTRFVPPSNLITRGSNLPSWGNSHAAHTHHPCVFRGGNAIGPDLLEAALAPEPKTLSWSKLLGVLCILCFSLLCMAAPFLAVLLSQAYPDTYDRAISRISGSSTTISPSRALWGKWHSRNSEGQRKEEDMQYRSIASH